MNTILFLSLFVSINLIEAIKSDDEVFQWDEEKYPNLTSPLMAKFCTGSIRNPPSSICDPDLILKRTEAIRLDQLIEEGQNSSKCFCSQCPQNKGLNIKVALAKIIKVLRNVSLDRSVEMFAERTRRKWRFGECGNDVLIFIASLDDRIYISLGSKARQVLSESDIKELLAQTRTHFTSGQYYQGLESIIASLQDLSQRYSAKSSKLGTGSIILIVICVSLVVIIILFAVFWFLIRKERKVLRGSFEYFGSWGKNKKSTVSRVQSTPRPKPRPTIEPIYTPVKTNENTEISDTTLPISDRK